MHHALAPLLAPRSVALVGASERAGTLGRTVLENLIAGRFEGALHPVNPKYRTVLGRRCWRALADIGETVDLAIIAAPAAAVPDILEHAKGRVRTVALLSFIDAEPARAEAWHDELLRAARAGGMRLVGPGAFGVIRTGLGLNATFCAPIARPGRLALVAQSGAVCTALLDFAAPLPIGFSTVTSLGGSIDVGFGEVLEALVHDRETDGILLYVESVNDARLFMSALRQAARIKPVVVLKAGRYAEPARDWDALGEPAIAPDTVFEAALGRAGTVRVRTYAQLFSAARILSVGRTPRGERLAIVSNGHGPGVLAADAARDAGVLLADLAPATVDALDRMLPPGRPRRNPVDVRGDASAARFAGAVEVVLADPGVDALVALHVPRPVANAVEAARAVAAVARGADKPVLGAWLGAIARPPVQEALEVGGVANYYTPEIAVEAFSFLATYRRSQEWLLEVPSSHVDPKPPDLAGAEDVRRTAQEERHGVLPPASAQRLLAAFGIATAPLTVVRTLAEAQAAARAVGYPVALTIEGGTGAGERTGIAHGRALARAWKELTAEEASGTLLASRIVLQSAPPVGEAGACALTLATDATFGPVIAAGPSIRGVAASRQRAVMLAPLNRRLARDLLTAAAITPHETLVHLVLQVSALACALPWVRGLALDPVLVVRGAARVGRARVEVDASRRPAPGYAHMAIHPYPVELEGTLRLRDGTELALRPVRPEDAEIERRFVEGLSDESRYFRFFYRMHEMTPAMLGRFTQVDYDRELALLALTPDPATPGGEAIVGVARFIANLDRESAEFAIVTADAWHGRGVGRALMQALIACARARGLKRLEGAVLRANQRMIRFTQGLGFTIADAPDDAEQVVATLVL
ncbi:MAG: GNAT family N-acetyltransferase [Burkholderiales bacterium]|nr:GNAT family N-acetyltransferase [Burkholderiales bacterium]